MIKLTIKARFKSPVLLGAGEGRGSVIDADIIFDSMGLPYFPGRRLKGLLRDSAQEILDLFFCSQTEIYSQDILDRAFGVTGDESGGLLIFDNLYLPDYDSTYQWCVWVCSNKVLGKYFSPEAIIRAFTETRTQTAVAEDGVVLDQSLRRYRILKEGTAFSGHMILKKDDEQEVIDLLALACQNLRRAGTRRNRGLGEVDCSLYFEESNLSQKVLDELRGVMAR
jgi:CRISPR/Cas system CSM-associated protein Csm3 (group 7 of RAMP superfamily)